jgi:hypothetical protein
MTVISHRQRPLLLVCLLVISCWLVVTLSGCSIQPLLDGVQASQEVLRPSGNGESLAISYQLGRDSTVSVYLQDEAGTRYPLRENQPRVADSNAYSVSFDGTVPTTEGQLRRKMLPSGTYTYVVEATEASGSSANASGQFRIENEGMVLPSIDNLLVSPSTISPNGDAIDDVANITYRLPVTSTVDITITTPEGQVYPFVTRAEQPPAEYLYTWNGKRSDGVALGNGSYIYTITAEDIYGNIAVQSGEIELVDVGQPEATIIEARIAPERVMLGDVITVTVRIRNTGTVPIRTYGPASGYGYSTDEVFSSVEDGAFAAKSGGFWRIGVDWDANSGGGAKRYPYRWALSSKPASEWTVPGVEDILEPGEEVVVTGTIQILQPENKMGFYVGLIQDGVGFRQDRTARTIIEVGF